MTDRTLEGKIDWIIQVLSTPLTPEEVTEGWNSESKEIIRIFFVDLKTKLTSGVNIPPVNIARALDHWGVVAGEVLEVAAQISNELRGQPKGAVSK